MENRESREQNNLFFLCSLIEYIGRRTHNRRSDVVRALGETELQHIYELADVYHCENMDKLSDEFSSKHSLKHGEYDNLSKAHYRIPTAYEIGRVMQRIISAVASEKQQSVTSVMQAVYDSWFAHAIDNYNSSLYYDNPSYQYESYKAGRALE